MVLALILHPPTPYTLSPLLKGGRGRGEEGSYTHVPCPFWALLVTLYHQIFSKRFLNGKGNIGAGGQPCGLAAGPGRSAPKGRSGQNISLHSEAS